MSDNESMCAEGKHVQLFRVRFRRIFDEICNNISAAEFKDIYGKHFKQNWSRADALYNIWIEHVQDDIMKDLDLFIKEAKLNEKLEKLADIVSKSEVDCRSLAWRPTGIPEEDFRAHRIQQKLQKNSELEEFVNNKELEVMELKNEISVGRARIEELDSEVQQLVAYSISDHDRHTDIQLKHMDSFQKMTESL